ncbi:MAG: threonine--tRNA ligase [Candidatus Levybacteria bacterium RIFCSPLOWO2_01_FULL_36_13]|nr:MAG: threonine--tRNA ligase [Candidatus Levybacteria bacterium RIFCSPHIGHO2_01_FULL_36_15b]OGH35510.1 MAG: threonine--tRNA ligase [Candidatus Levybacteria bacterium RIFCSPLOWO2_01_FULL_36_13]
MANKSHQEIGQEQDLFTFSDLVGAGLPLFTPKGAMLRRILQGYIEDILEKHEYKFVWIPHISRKELYEKSGHLEKFSEDMFPTIKAKGREYNLKPANCPHHIQIFARKPISYREMPQRYAETTTQYRSEQSGELEGLVRVLGLTLDDSHVFARPDQIKEEFRRALEINQIMLKDFGLEYWIRLSAWDKNNKNKYLGDEKTWEKMQNLMAEILDELKIEYKRIDGEAAFYGPKMDLMIKDSLGKEWQLSTIQVDFNLPERFNLSYIDESNQKVRPIMLHRATFGSYERFLAMIIEHYQGAFPLWLSPVQVAILPITDSQLNYAKDVQERLTAQGVRVELDSRSERLQAKIRDAALQKVPYLAIIGEKETEANSVSVRDREGKDLGKTSLDDFLQKLKKEIDKKV